MQSSFVKFIVAVAYQVLVIIIIVLSKTFVITSGTRIQLKATPQINNSYLRGDYVHLKYDDISVMDYTLLDGQKVKNGQSVYVVLKKLTKYWIPKKIQLKRPSYKEVFIKGKVDTRELRIIYGIEDYFIPQGKFHNGLFKREFSAKVVVDQNGNAVVTSILVDNKPWP